MGPEPGWGNVCSPTTTIPAPLLSVMTLCSTRLSVPNNRTPPVSTPPSPLLTMVFPVMVNRPSDRKLSTPNPPLSTIRLLVIVASPDRTKSMPSFLTSTVATLRISFPSIVQWSLESNSLMPPFSENPIKLFWMVPESAANTTIPNCDPNAVGGATNAFASEPIKLS